MKIKITLKLNYLGWKADLRTINSFWSEKGEASYGSSRMAPSNFNKRTDYQYLLPSCSTKNFYAAPGVRLRINNW